ncbi:MAG: hypothetical protein ABIR70_03180 [Bryobacteraceae bacterium]
MFACLYAPGNLPLLLECAAHFSPLIEETSPDTVVFDVRGLGRIYGAPEQLAAAILAHAVPDAHVAIAANPDAAVHAARGFKGITVIPQNKEAAVLAPLPLFFLGGSPDFARNLDLWGIRSFGEFAALPPIGVTSRLGDEGTHLHQLANGAGHRQLRLRIDPQVFREERELEESIDLLEPLLFLLSQMLDQLCERLRYHGRYTNELRLRLKLERTDHTATLRLPVPMLNPKVLLKLVQLELNERPPRAPIERIHLELAPVEPRTTQHGLFLPQAPEPEKLEITLSRIRGLVGASNVGSPEILDTHRPDAFRMTGLTRSKEVDLPLRPKLALRRFRPRRPAQVWCTNQGLPARVSSSLGGGPVIACAGPWHYAGDWWTNEKWDRYEWDIEVRDLGVSRLSQDTLLQRWFIEGIYD